MDEKVAGALIAHLSKEIEVQVNAMAAWRSRVNFTAYFGPWIVLGGYFAITKESLQWPQEPMCLLILLPLLAAAYVVVGYACGRVEAQSWTQCNRWRDAISLLLKGEDPGDIRFEHKVLRAYVLVYLLMLTVFALGAFSLSQLTA